MSLFISNEKEKDIPIVYLFKKIRNLQQLHRTVHMQLLGKSVFHFSNEHVSDKWYRATAVM